MEIWKAIPGAETYMVSSLGRVRKGDIILAITKQKAGYCVCSIKNKTKYVHRLVAEAFLDGVGEIDHIDGDKGNNRVENLERVTHQENVRRAYAGKGCRNPSGKGKPVIARLGDSYAIFASGRSAARALGRSQAAISNGCKYGYKVSGWKVSFVG